MEILQEDGAAIASALGRGIELIGLGTGAGTKTRILLERLQSPTAYMPVDISKEQLTQSTAAFGQQFPALEILPVCTDYLEPFELPVPLREPTRKVVYFPGSTIGNLERNTARAFLGKIAGIAGQRGGLLIGVGGLLALVPGSRRRATDPASASSPLVTDAQPGAHREREAAAPEPVGALVARGTGPA